MSRLKADVSAGSSSEKSSSFGQEGSDKSDDFRTKIERLFRQQNPALLGMLYLRLHDKEWARDVAQEAYERVFAREKNETFALVQAAAMGHLRNYLFKTALHIASNRIRDTRVRSARLTSYFVEDEAPSAETQCIQRIERTAATMPDRIYFSGNRMS
jgi:DNA-directed RNA polymerase specialized sigma24 family protein